MLLRPLENLLAMTFLSYAAELKPIEDFLPEAPAVPIGDDEAEMAKRLTEAMAIDDLDLAAYQDDYNEKLRELVEAKVKGEEVVRAPIEPPTIAVGNLMEALQRSLATAKAKAPPRAAAGKPPKLAADSVGVAGVKRQQRRRKTS